MFRQIPWHLHTYQTTGMYLPQHVQLQLNSILLSPKSFDHRLQNHLRRHLQDQPWLAVHHVFEDEKMLRVQNILPRHQEGLTHFQQGFGCHHNRLSQRLPCPYYHFNSTSLGVPQDTLSSHLYSGSLPLIESLYVME